MYAVTYETKDMGGVDSMFGSYGSGYNFFIRDIYYE